MDLLWFAMKVFGAISAACLIAIVLVAVFLSGPDPDDLSGGESEGR